MLFWLGSIKFQTPWGRFILTGAREVRGFRRRLATKEEAAKVWPYIRWQLMTASYNELLPLYELYQELTSESYYGPHGEPHVSLVLDAIRSALWTNKLHFEFEAPFDPPSPEPEWEPPPLDKLRKYIPPQTPSEIWGRRDKETFIGIRLKDQNNKPIIGSRIQVKLPDGHTKEGKTNTDGELEIKGFTQDGNADITFLDHCKPGKAEAPEWPEEKEFKATVVDEIGNPVSGVWLWFRHGNASNLVRTDGSGVAKYKTITADSVSVSFESATALAQVMSTIWTESRGKARKDWVQQDDTTTTVSIFGGNIVRAIADNATTASTRPKETLEPFIGVESTVDNPVSLSVQPLVIMVRMLGELFDTDKCFLLPKALDNAKDLVKLREEYTLTALLIVGHTDTAGKEDYNVDLSLERTNAMSAYLTNDADVWLEWYDSSKKESKRWSTTEDTYMIQTLLGDPGCPPAPDGTPYPQTVLGYQQWHNAQAPRLSGYEALTEDGKIGPATRKQLILDYMHREDTTAPAGTLIQVHGCGEFFPVEASGEQLDSNATDGQHEQEDRRVEVFLFPKEVGLLPPVPGEKATKGELEYAEWRRRSIDFELLGISALVLWVEEEPMVQVTDGDAPAGSEDKGPENTNAQV